MYTIPQTLRSNIKSILFQVGGPTKIDYTAKNRFFMFYDLISDLQKTFTDIEDSKDLLLDSFQYFSLISVLSFIIEDLGEYEFSTVTGLDFYENGIKLICDLKKQIMK